MEKPIKPEIKIPAAFALEGQKTDFVEEKIQKGFSNVDPDVLAGDNLNKFIDDTYQGLTYSMKGTDALNMIKEGEVLTVKDGEFQSAEIESGASRNIGETVFSLLPLSDASLHLCDGALIDGGGIYNSFVSYIADLYGDGTSIPAYFTTEEKWQQSVSQYGVCGKFVYDKVANTIRLPKITGIIEGTLDETALGDLVQAGLPALNLSTNSAGAHTHTRGTMDITGTWKWHVVNEDFSGVSVAGAFTSSNAGNIGGWGFQGDGECRCIQQDFVASRAWTGTTSSNGAHTHTITSNSSIIGNSDTIQPQTIKGFLYLVVGNSKKVDIEVNIDNVATDLNNQAGRITTLENTTLKNFQITNCITKIPQRINLALDVSANTLTLKSGSVVIVPNGFEADEITPRFDYIPITEDKTITGAGFGGSYTDCTICYNVSEGNMTINSGKLGWRRMTIETATDATQPTFSSRYGIWYDTTANLIKYIWDNNVLQSGNLSFPLCLGSNTQEQIDSIYQIFNGFGYIGTCTWVDKGVKALFADGRNPDGSMKNLEIITDKCRIRDISNEVSEIGRLGDNGYLHGWGTHNIFYQDEEPTGFGNSAIWYSPAKNLTFHTSNNGVTWNKIYSIQIGILKKMLSENISQMTQPQTLDLLKRSDFSEISRLSAPSDELISLSVPKSGTVITASRTGWYYIKGTSNAVSQAIGLNVNGVIGVSPHSAAITNGLVTCAFVRKGGKVTVFYNTPTINFFGFCPAEGEV